MHNLKTQLALLIDYDSAIQEEHQDMLLMLGREYYPIFQLPLHHRHLSPHLQQILKKNWLEAFAYYHQLLLMIFLEKLLVLHLLI